MIVPHIIWYMVAMLICVPSTLFKIYLYYLIGAEVKSQVCMIVCMSFCVCHYASCCIPVISIEKNPPHHVYTLVMLPASCG